MVLFTWVMIEPSSTLPLPVKSREKTLTLKATMATTMKRISGAILAMVVTKLTIAACRTPDRISAWMSQSTMEAPTIACQVLPWLNDGKK